MSIVIKKVNTNCELRKFIQFNYELYKNNPYSVPDLYSDTKKTLSKNKNAAFEFCEAEYFIAYKDGKIAGRVAAIINHKANSTWNKKDVRFGWIDFIDDKDVSKALIKAVEDWGKEKGMTEICGPLGFTDFDPEGMLIDGFDQLGTMTTIYNYPYYPTHLEDLGFKKDTDWVEYLLTIPNSIPEKHKRISELVLKKYGLSIKKYSSSKKLQEECGLKIFQLMNEAYAPLFGYSELSPKQIEQYIKAYLPLVDLKMLTIVVDQEDNLIAVGISMPSLSRALQKAKGKLFPLGWYHLYKALYKKKRSDIVDLLLVAVKPEYQGKGVNALLFSNLIPIYKELGFVFAETNPELETNNKVQAQWEYFERKQHKRRRAYTKTIE